MKRGEGSASSLLESSMMLLGLADRSTSATLRKPVRVPDPAGPIQTRSGPSHLSGAVSLVSPVQGPFSHSAVPFTFAKEISHMNEKV